MSEDPPRGFYGDRMMRPGAVRIPQPVSSGRYYVVRAPGSGAKPELVHYDADAEEVVVGQLALKPQPGWLWFAAER